MGHLSLVVWLFGNIVAFAEESAQLSSCHSIKLLSSVSLAMLQVLHEMQSYSQVITSRNGILYPWIIQFHPWHNLPGNLVGILPGVLAGTAPGKEEDVGQNKRVPLYLLTRCVMRDAVSIGKTF